MAAAIRTERVLTLMTPAELHALDEWAHEHRIKSRGDAIRQLIRIGIDADTPAPGVKRQEGCTI